MDDIGGGPGLRPNLVDRVKNILLKPQEEWPRIEAEPDGIGDIYRGYVVPLAAIGPVANFIGAVAFGYSLFGVTYRPSIAGALSQAVVSYVLTLVGVYLLALVIDWLAPNFGGTRNRVAAFKVAAYSATAGWVAGIFGLIPALSILAILGLYSLYLLYLGLPQLMKAPKDKAVAYIAVVIVVLIIAAVVVSALTRSLTSLFVPSPYAPSTVTGTLEVPGAGSVDLAKLNAAAAKAEAAARNVEAAAKGAGTATALPPATLQAMLPEALPGMARTSLSSSSANAGGVGGATAQAHYGAGPASITLEVTDLGAAAAFAAMGSALNVQSTNQDADGYEKVGKVDGRMVTEKWRSGARSGSYGVLVADRFMVQAEGEGTSIDALKGAVGRIDFGTLENLAKS